MQRDEAWQRELDIAAEGRRESAAMNSGAAHSLVTGKPMPLQGMHWIDADAMAELQAAAKRPAPTAEQRIIGALQVAVSGERATAQARCHVMHPMAALTPERRLQDRAELVLQIAARAMLRRLPPELIAQISQELEAALADQFPRPQALDGGNHFRPESHRPAPWETRS